MWFFPMYFIFQFGIPKLLHAHSFGEHGDKPYLDSQMHAHMNNHDIEWGGGTLDAKWLHHIHSEEILLHACY